MWRSPGTKYCLTQGKKEKKGGESEGGEEGKEDRKEGHRGYIGAREGTWLPVSELAPLVLTRGFGLVLRLPPLSPQQKLLPKYPVQ